MEPPSSARRFTRYGPENSDYNEVDPVSRNVLSVWSGFQAEWSVPPTAVDGVLSVLQGPDNVCFFRLKSTMLTILHGQHSLLKSSRTLRREFSKTQARYVSRDVLEFQLDVTLILELLGYPDISWREFIAKLYDIEERLGSMQKYILPQERGSDSPKINRKVRRLNRSTVHATIKDDYRDSPRSSTRTVRDNHSAVSTGAIPTDPETSFPGYDSYSDTSSSWWSTDCSDIAAWMMEGDEKSPVGLFKCSYCCSAAALFTNERSYNFV